MQMKSPAAGLSAETSGFLSQTCHNLMSNWQTDTETTKKRKDLGLYSSEECEGYSMFHLTFIGAEHMTGPGPDP